MTSIRRNPGSPALPPSRAGFGIPIANPKSEIRNRRAFALPLVVLLVLIGGLSVALLMERHGVSYHSIARHVANYKNHHRAAGIKECVLRWLDTARGRLIQNLDDDGMAFKMEVSGEGHIDVFFRDAQGATLSDPSALSGRRREIVEDMKFLLEQTDPKSRPDGLFRPVGPAEISLDSAPELVIRALCLAVVGEPGKADQAARALLSRHEGGRSSTDDLATALADAPITQRQRREIAAMLTVNPTLFEVTAETRGSSESLLNRASGLYQIDTNRSDTFKQGGAFLTWDDIPLDSK